MHQLKYCNDPKFSDRQVWANSVNPDQTALNQTLLEEESDLGPHCLPFCLHVLDAFLYGKTIQFKS